MRLGHIEVFVTDPMRSKDFYESVLGFTVDTVQGGKFVWLTMGKSTVLLRPARRRQAADSYQEAGSAMVLYCDDLSAMRARLEEAGLEFRGTDGSPDCLTFTDPDGNWFQLVNPAGH